MYKNAAAFATDYFFIVAKAALGIISILLIPRRYI